MKPTTKYAIAIPSARRQGADYLADTVAHLAQQLGPEHDRIDSINVYCPNPVDGIVHQGIESVRRIRDQGGFGVLNERIHIRGVDDLPEHLYAKVASSREPYSIRHCHDFAFTLYFANQTGADHVLFLEDDTRLANQFCAKADRVLRRAALRQPAPAFISMFSWDYGPPGTWWPFFGYSQGLLFANQEDLRHAIEFLLAYRAPGGADKALADWRFNERVGQIAYPSLVQHIGEVSGVFAGRQTLLHAPTFRNDGFGLLDAVTSTAGWLWRSVLRRIKPNFAP